MAGPPAECNCVHLAEDHDDRMAWVLAGTGRGRGPDNEPMVQLDEVVAYLAPELVEKAKDRHRRTWPATLTPTRSGAGPGRRRGAHRKPG